METHDKIKQTNCFIFDLDGTIVDTQTEFHARAECEVLKKYCRITITPEEISARFAGIATTKVFKELAPGFEADFLAEKKWETIFKLAEKNEIKCLPKMDDLILLLFENNVPMAIGSASPQKWINTCLEKIKIGKKKIPLTDIFKGCNASAEDCINGKPAPDVFLLAEDRLFTTRGDEEIVHKIFIIGDGRSDVKAGLTMEANILYLSDTDFAYDAHPKVKRFTSSDLLVNYIIKSLLNL
jgi:beta-phosphoglucomutase-like phosphatase (HAD superfamily)